MAFSAFYCLSLSGSDNGIGLELAGLTDNNDEYGIFINHIRPHSIADQCKTLQ